MDSQNLNTAPIEKSVSTERSSVAWECPSTSWGLRQLGGPTYDLPFYDTTEKKFSGRARLFIGNLPHVVSYKKLFRMFRKYGEIKPSRITDQNFLFVQFDYRQNAIKAQRALDRTILKGKVLKIRFSTNNCTIKVKNLTKYVTNELLYEAFSIFGKIERCYIIVHNSGMSTRQGIIDFVERTSAMLAISKCSEKVFYLTASLFPVSVEAYEDFDDFSGYPDRNLIKTKDAFIRAREVPPRFALANTYSYAFGMRWKELDRIYAAKHQALEEELKTQRQLLRTHMNTPRHDYDEEEDINISTQHPDVNGQLEQTSTHWQQGPCPVPLVTPTPRVVHQMPLLVPQQVLMLPQQITNFQSNMVYNGFYAPQGEGSS